jgi:hypothetical protein
LYKIAVRGSDFDNTVKKIQSNLATRLFLKKQEFYAHFYRERELIIVFRQRIFNATPDKESWEDAVNYGISVGISPKQLDFSPCRFEDERF